MDHRGRSPIDIVIQLCGTQRRVWHEPGIFRLWEFKIVGRGKYKFTKDAQLQGGGYSVALISITPPMKPAKWSDWWLVILAIMLTLDITVIIIISTKFVKHEKEHPIIIIPGKHRRCDSAATGEGHGERLTHM